LGFEYRADGRENRASVKSAFPAVVALLILAGCAVRREPVERREVWMAIQPAAAHYHLDPVFIYALVAAESNFDARARHGEARGLLQLKPAAWATVSARPYEPTVWDWRANLETGIDYLMWCRHSLHAHGRFSEPLLLAAFHYGFDYVESRGFDERRIPEPDHPLYRELWRGNLHPVTPPAGGPADR
jgi:soluble lytic murein transglycosylase-like protein